MLHYAAGPRGEGSFLNLPNAPDGLAPLDYHRDTPEACRVQLRAAYVHDPRSFLRLVRDARVRNLPIVSADPPGLARTR